MADWTLVGLSWLTTYLLHSTLLLGIAWTVTRLWKRIPDDLQEVLWKTALCGGLLTTTWQIVTPTAPYAGQVQLSAAPTASAAAPLPLAIPAGDAPAAAPIEMPFDPAAAEILPATQTAAPSAEWDWNAIALWAYASLVTLSFAHLGLARFFFHRQLADRRLVTSGEMPLQLLTLIERAGFGRAVRLTCSGRISTPIAFGFTQPEICIPTRALHELRPDEQQSMLAHELAHLIHRDPAWLLVCQLLQRALFLQPLHYVARWELQRLAEYRCDAWATRHADSKTSLARCLVEVARWMTPGTPALAHAPGMAARRSMLWQRVDRILETKAQARASWTGVAGSVVLLAAAATALPGASWIEDEAEPANAEALPAVQMLDTGPALVALNDELSWLEGELAELRSLLAADPDPELHTLVQQLEDAAVALRARRDHMQSMLPSTLDALRPLASQTEQAHEIQGETR